MLDKLSEHLLKFLEAEHVKPGEAPALYEALERAAKKLGIDTPKVHIVPEKTFNDKFIDAVSLMPNAAAIAKDKIIISKPMLRLMEHEDMATASVSKEFEAVLAHEMYHCGGHAKQVLGRAVPLFMMPAAAMTGLYLYKRAQKKAAKTQDHSPEAIKQHIEEATQHQLAGIAAQKNSHPLMSSLVTVGGYLAAGYAGFEVGKQGTRFLTNRIEHAADRFAAKHVGKDPMVNALKMIYDHAGRTVSEAKELESAKILPTWREALASHPSFYKRAAHIRGS